MSPMSTGMFLLLADAVLVLHFSIVVFVVGGLALVLVGNWRRWAWVNARWFRYAHLAAIAQSLAWPWRWLGGAFLHGLCRGRVRSLFFNRRSAWSGRCLMHPEV